MKGEMSSQEITYTQEGRVGEHVECNKMHVVHRRRLTVS